MNYYNRHIGDYARDTAHLTFAEDGAYNRMLDHYYTTEAPLPLDRTLLYRKLRARSKADRDIVDALLVEFFREAADGWHKKRCDEEIEKYQRKAEKNRENGKQGGRPPKNPTETQMVSKRNPNETLASSQEPRTKNQETATPPPPGAVAPDWLPPEFREYELHRAEKRQKLTPTARAGCVRKLERWRSEGHDIVAILRYSIDNGYTGLIDPNERKGGNGKAHGVTAGNIAATQEWLRREREKDEKPAS